MKDTTKKVIAGTLIAGAGLLGGVAINGNNPDVQLGNSEVQEIQSQENGFKAKKVNEIKAIDVLDSSEKSQRFKRIHGEIVLPNSKDEKVLVKERFYDKEVTIEDRMAHLQIVMEDALENSDLQMSFYDNAKAEYEQLLEIYNQ